MIDSNRIKDNRNKLYKEYLSKLTDGLNIYERNVVNKIKDKQNRTDFSRNLTILSDTTCHRSFGIIGLGDLINRFPDKYSNRFPTYSVVSLQSAIYYNYNRDDANEFLWDEVLIICGNYRGLKKDKLPEFDEQLAEIINIRSNDNRITWLFLEDVTVQELKKTLPVTLRFAPLEKVIVTKGGNK